MIANRDTRRRKDSNLLAVTQRSNALAFSRHHFLSASTTLSEPPPKRRHNTALSQISGNPQSKVKERNSLLMPVSEHSKTDILASPQSIKSLIPPMIHIRAKPQKRRSSTSSLRSISSGTSMSSTMFSRKRKHTVYSNLATVPFEILSCILQYLDQIDHHNLMLTNSNLLESAAIFLYHYPHFASTYRYAQFAYTVSHNASYASMVRILDLSYFTKILDEDGELPPQAGWREFTYRHHHINHTNHMRDRTNLLGSGIKYTQSGSTHPLPSPFLKNFHRTRDLPVGAICHVLASCKEIRKLNISRLQLTIDYSLSFPSTAIPTPSSHKQTYMSDSTTSHQTMSTRHATSPTAITEISSFGHSFSRPQTHLTPVTIDNIIMHLQKLPYLEEVKAKDFLWLTGEKVRVLVMGCGKLGRVDFRGSGLNRDSRWAVKGDRELILRVLGVDA